MQCHRRELLKRLAAVLELGSTQVDGIRLRKRYLKVREQLLVLMSDREVPTTNNLSEQALHMSAVFRKVTNGFRVEWSAESCTAARGRWWPRAASKDSRRWPRCARRWRVTASSRRGQPRAPKTGLARRHPAPTPSRQRHVGGRRAITRSAPATSHWLSGFAEWESWRLSGGESGGCLLMWCHSDEIRIGTPCRMKLGESSLAIRNESRVPISRSVWAPSCHPGMCALRTPELRAAE